MRFTAIDLGAAAKSGDVPYFYETIPMVLNDRGQVAGLLNTKQGSAGYFLFANGLLTSRLGTPQAINNSGQIVSEFAINDAGVTAGIDSFGRAYSYQNGVMTPLGTLESGGRSEATAINNAGQVVGTATLGGVSQPVVFTAGSAISLGVPSSYVGGVARDINNGGDITGFYSSSDGNYQAFANIAGKNISLGTLGGSSSDAKSINDAGSIVGWSRIASGAMHAFLYEGGKMFDLNALVTVGGGLTLTEAVGINNVGQIAVRAVDASGREFGQLLTPNPVPEPTTLALAGVVGLVLVTRRLRR